MYFSSLTLLFFWYTGMYFSSLTLLFLFLLTSFSKRGAMLLIATPVSAGAFKRFLDFVLIGKRVLNSDPLGYVVGNGISTVSAVSQSLGSITIAEHSSKVLLSDDISRERRRVNFLSVRRTVLAPLV